MGKIGFVAAISLVTLIPLILAANDPQQVYASKPCSPGREREDCASRESFMSCSRQTQNAPYGCTCMRFQPTNTFNWSHPYFNHIQRKCVLPVGEYCEYTKPKPKILCEPNLVCIQLKDDEKMSDYGICEFTQPEPKILCEKNSDCIQLKDDEKMKDYGICSGAMQKDGSFFIMGFIFVTAIMANFFNTK